MGLKPTKKNCSLERDGSPRTVRLQSNPRT